MSNEQKPGIIRVTKRPVTVEAYHFTDESKDSVWRWANEIQMNVYPGREDDGAPCLRIPTNEGEMTCSLGDWLIREPFSTNDRKLYPCKADIFEKTYVNSVDPEGEQKPLTAEEIKEDFLSRFRYNPNYEYIKMAYEEGAKLYVPSDSSIEDIFAANLRGMLPTLTTTGAAEQLSIAAKKSMQQYAAQQVAAKDTRIKELEENYRQLSKEYEDAQKEAESNGAKWAEWDTMLSKERAQLEAVKKERDRLRISRFNYAGQMLTVMQQRGEAVKLLEWTINTLSEDPTRTGIVIMEIADKLPRLSSGETKPPEIPGNFTDPY